MFSSNRTVWECLVSKIGIWGAILVFAALGAAFIVATATGPFGVALTVWLISTFGGGTAVLILNCIRNPNG
jgi:hypothetical protein